MKSKTITKEIISKFEIHLFEDEKSENTVEKYIRDVKALQVWSEELGVRS